MESSLVPNYRRVRDWNFVHFHGLRTSKSKMPDISIRIRHVNKGNDGRAYKMSQHSVEKTLEKKKRSWIISCNIKIISWNLRRHRNLKMCYQKYQHCLAKPTEKWKAKQIGSYPTSSISSDDPPRPFANSPQLWAGPQKLSFFPLRSPNVCTAIKRTQKTWSHLQALHCGGKIAKIAVLDKNLQKNWSHPLLKKILPHRLLKLLLPICYETFTTLKTLNLAEQQILQQSGAPPTYKLSGNKIYL